MPFNTRIVHEPPGPPQAVQGPVALGTTEPGTDMPTTDVALPACPVVPTWVLDAEDCCVNSTSSEASSVSDCPQPHLQEELTS